MREHRRIAAGIEQYVFSLKDHGLTFDLNVTALIEGNKALLIDVGYKEQALAVQEALTKRGIGVEAVILSHYHPDHSAGASVFPDATLYCNKDYKVNYTNCQDVWDVENDYKEADEIVYSGEVITFESFKCQVFDTPGHSICGMTTIINDCFIHVGDLVMNDDAEHPALPLVCKDGGIHEHIQSLEWLKNHTDKIALLPHGKTIDVAEVFAIAIDMREKYLKSLIESYEMWHDEDYENKHLEGWACANWHKGNMKQAKKLVL